METLIPLVKLKGKLLSCNGRKETFYNDKYMQEGKREERERGALPSGTPLLLAPVSMWLGLWVWGLTRGWVRGYKVAGSCYLSLCSLPPVQQGLCRNSETKHIRWRPWDREVSGAGVLRCTHFPTQDSLCPMLPKATAPRPGVHTYMWS